MFSLFSLFIQPFHRKADPVLLLIHTENTNLHNISDAYSFQRMFDKFFTHLGNMNKSVLMNSDINESSEIDYVADSSFQDHTLFQILDIQYVCAENRLRHLITRISCRFLQLFYNIPKSNLSNFQFICSLLVIPDLSGKSGKLASCNILSGISQFLKKPGSRLIALRVNACRVERDWSRL